VLLIENLLMKGASGSPPADPAQPFINTWGYNNRGQLGDGTSGPSARKSSPVQIGSSSWTAVSAGYDHNAAIRSDGALFTWGYNSSGQLGDGTIISRSSPVQIGSSSWTAVTTGVAHSAAIRSDGRLFTWGSGNNGRLGDGTTVNKSSPVQIGSSSWTAVSAGSYHNAAIRLGGSLFTWGFNGPGQLGDGTTAARSSPVQLGSSSWTAVSAGASHTVAIRSDGGLFIWGLNNNGQLGDNAATKVNRSSPVQLGSSSWTAVSAGRFMTAAIRSGGGLFTWGATSYGMLGEQIDLGSTFSWTTISAGTYWNVAIRSDGGLFTWGYQSFGRLGNGVQGYSGVSSPVQIGSSSWTAVSSGLNHGGAIRSGGTLFMWGRNQTGYIGDGTIFANRSSPVQIGGGTFTLSTSSPVQIGASSWTAVSASGFNGAHTVAIRSDGGLFAWGRNTSGQLSDGTAASRSSPVQVGSSSWTAVSAGSTHTAAIRSGNILYTWGGSASGQGGRGAAFTRSSPVQVGNNVMAVDARSSPVQLGTSSWTAVSAGLSHVGAISSTGRLYMWGANDFGQLGQNNTLEILSPVQVGTRSFTLISVGRRHTIAR